MDTRKPTFLSQHAWRTEPFLIYPPSDIQLLMDDAVTLPSLLEAIDLLGSLASEKAILEAHRIQSGLLEIHASLCKWKSLYRVEASCPWFPDIMSANIHIHTWAFEIICLTELEKANFFLAEHERTFESVPAVGQTLEKNSYSHKQVLELACKICQSVDYLIQEEMRLFGPASAVVPLRIAYTVLSRDCERNQENIKRCQEQIGRIRSRGISAVPHFTAKLVEVDG